MLGRRNKKKSSNDCRVECCRRTDGQSYFTILVPNSTNHKNEMEKYPLKNPWIFTNDFSKIGAAIMSYNQDLIFCAGLSSVNTVCIAAKPNMHLNEIGFWCKLTDIFVYLLDLSHSSNHWTIFDNLPSAGFRQFCEYWMRMRCLTRFRARLQCEKFRLSATVTCTSVLFKHKH